MCKSKYGVGSQEERGKSPHADRVSQQTIQYSILPHRQHSMTTRVKKLQIINFLNRQSLHFSPPTSASKIDISRRPRNIRSPVMIIHGISLIQIHLEEFIMRRAFEVFIAIYSSVYHSSFFFFLYYTMHEISLLSTLKSEMIKCMDDLLLLTNSTSGNWLGSDVVRRSR